jgi:protein-tyrosine phosphatase
MNRGVIKRAALWLVFLGPFFYASYGFANYLASLRTNVPNITFGWEHAIPFVEWTIIPYWSVNLFYIATLFANDGTAGVDRTAKRYLTCQIIAIACFIAFPLKAVFIKPETSGLTGFLFDALGSFDKPFNQAPSLHIALVVVIWDHWRTRFTGAARIVWHLWTFMIGASVLTTYQHHFIDIPTGALLGLFALWLFPSYLSPQTRRSIPQKSGFYYAFGSILFTAAAFLGAKWTPLALFCIWPALSLAIVAAAYLGLGVSVFQKQPDGEVSLASYWLLMPCRLGAKINAWAWTQNLPASVQISGNVHLGRFPNESEIKGFTSVIDLTGEMLVPKHQGVHWMAYPVLDLTAPPIQTLRDAAQAIQMTQKNGKTLVCCALGMQRSAAAVALWLVRCGKAADASQALDILRQSGRPVHLNAAIVEGALAA